MFCVFLILVILLQTGKGAGMGAAFGGSSSTVFGPRGAGSFIGKMTGIVAALFMISSLTLAYVSSSNSSSLEDRAALASEKTGGKEVDLDDLKGTTTSTEAEEKTEEETQPAEAPSPDASNPRPSCPQPKKLSTTTRSPRLPRAKTSPLKTP